jgi:hypothetical protein
MLLPPLRNLLGLAPVGPLEIGLVVAGSVLPLLLNDALAPSAPEPEGGASP